MKVTKDMEGQRVLVRCDRSDLDELLIVEVGKKAARVRRPNGFECWESFEDIEWWDLIEVLPREHAPWQID